MQYQGSHYRQATFGWLLIKYICVGWWHRMVVNVGVQNHRVQVSILSDSLQCCHSSWRKDDGLRRLSVLTVIAWFTHLTHVVAVVVNNFDLWSSSHQMTLLSFRFQGIFVPFKLQGRESRSREHLLFTKRRVTHRVKREWHLTETSRQDMSSLKTLLCWMSRRETNTLLLDFPCTSLDQDPLKETPATIILCCLS